MTCDKTPKCAQPCGLCPEQWPVPAGNEYGEPNLMQLIGEYFDLGVAEGRESRDHDTKDGAAQRKLSEIRAALANQSPAAPAQSAGVPAVQSPAEGDERAKFEAWWGTQSSGFKPDAWVAWQARAALSNVQPKGTAKLTDEQIIKMIDKDGRGLACEFVSSAPVVGIDAAIEAIRVALEGTPAPAPGAEADKWRKLAQQFDGQRMAAMAHLKTLLAFPDTHADAVRKFLAATPTEQQPDAVPPNCRQRLQAEGKPYQRSSCATCGKFSPRARLCDSVMAAAKRPDRAGMAYYKNDKCTAPSADHPDCICWTHAAQPDSVKPGQAQAPAVAHEPVDIDDLKDRLVAASAAVADQDDRSAQAILSETLKLLNKGAP